MGVALLALSLVAICVLVGLARRSSRLPLPPGPKPRPIVGNIFDMPTVRPWEKYHEWCKTFDSDIICVQIPMRSIVILGSYQAAVDLLDQKSQIYSDRIRFVVVEMMSWDFNFGSLRYGPRWRAHRQMLRQHLRPPHEYAGIQMKEARAFLRAVLETPRDTRKHLSEDRSHVATIKIAGEGLSKAVIPGAYLVEFFPILRHIPSWVPGTTARKLANEYAPHVRKLRDAPFLEVKAAYNQGKAPASMATDMIEHIRNKFAGTPQESEYEQIAMNVVGATYAASADTTTSASESFLLAMALYPEVQKKAQSELDRIIGSDRLPTPADAENIPLIRAIAMETLRWMPVTPFGVPHATSADDVYKGYHIPKGSSIVPNIWAMLHNADDYPEPDTFRPDRFIGQSGEIDPNVRDPTLIAFGFGRRGCPGKQFAISTLCIYIASVLHVFDIAAGVDDDGKPVRLTPEMDGAMLANPLEVPCGLTPRSEAAARLIRDA
ncbi:cytochrome P450 [Cristinia sonorae]|uniref:Cytochrome P450 n=1 Tax=Cristinia sonorae TaxID=1940300 RepID=A0A8K0UUA0_9AGAR|nr:cytochrome P450 [Cristinia sonorae]